MGSQVIIIGCLLVIIIGGRFRGRGRLSIRVIG